MTEEEAAGVTEEESAGVAEEESAGVTEERTAGVAGFGGEGLDVHYGAEDSIIRAGDWRRGRRRRRRTMPSMRQRAGGVKARRAQEVYRDSAARSVADTHRSTSTPLRRAAACAAANARGETGTRWRGFCGFLPMRAQKSR